MPAPRDPIDDRILRVLEKNATQQPRRTSRSAIPRPSSRSLTPLLLVLLPAGAVAAAVVALLGPLSHRRFNPSKAPAAPSAAPGQRPLTKATSAAKPSIGPVTSGNGATGHSAPTNAPAAAGATGARSTASPAAGSTPAAGRAGDPPLPPARRAATPARGWGHGSSAAPPPPASGNTNPAPRPADGFQERSAVPGPAASLTALRITNPSFQSSDQPQALPAGSHESEGWIELEASAPPRLQGSGASASPAR